MSSSLLSLRGTISQIHPRVIQYARYFSHFPSTCSRGKNPFANAANKSKSSITTTKQAKNPFVAPANSVLAYVGPYAASLRQCKSVAFVFGACGCIAVPSTLFLGNTEHFLAILAGVVSLSPSVLLHTLFRNDVTKIHVQGSASNKTPAVISVSASDALKLTIEKLNWRGVPLQSQVLSTNLFVKSETEKTMTWTTSSATPVPTAASSASSRSHPSKPTSTSQSKKETYRIDKLMMLTNPFAGQNIGHLRLAVVGDSGVGKTSFARQFVETLPEVLSHDWEPSTTMHKKGGNKRLNDDGAENYENDEVEDEDDDYDYTRTETLTEKFSSTMMEIPWDNMDADDEVPARNLVFLDTPGYGSVVDARTNFDLFMNYVGQTFEEKNRRISPFTEVSNNELMRSLVT
ncbi:hypothetical protein BGX28_008390, partial [Mortierella sp. GBA30]